MGSGWDLIKEGFELFDRAGKEFAELMTDGLVKTILGLESNYRTSYQKMDDAEGVIDEGKEQYAKTLRGLERTIRSTQKAAMEFSSEKLALQGSLMKEGLEALRPLVGDHPEELLEGQKRFAFLAPKPMRTLADDLRRSQVRLQKLTEEDVHFPITRQKVSGASMLSFKIPDLINAPVTLSIPLLGPVSGISMVLVQQGQRIRHANNYLAEAESFSQRVQIQIGRLKLEKSKLNAIAQRIKEGRELLRRTAELLSKQLEAVRGIKVHRVFGFKTGLSGEQKKTIMVAFVLLTALDNLCQAPVIGSDGKVSAALDALLKGIRGSLADLQAE